MTTVRRRTKYIFDFDDVLFNTIEFKEHIFRSIVDTITDTEVSREKAEKEVKEHYLDVREQEFSLKRFIATFFTLYDFHGLTIDALYQKIMARCPEFVNTALVEEVSRINEGKDYCYVVTNGDQEFNRDKLKYSGIGDIFDQDKIHIVPKNKAETIQGICERGASFNFVFIDDKVRFIEEGGLKDIPNLRVRLHKPGNPINLTEGEILGAGKPSSELKKRH